MKDLLQQGHKLRSKAKELAISALQKHPDGNKNGKGVKQAEVFRLCGLDWGNYPKALSTQQQYWVVALLRELEADGLVEQVEDKGPWRLK
ncbi:hypothetical protein RM345_003047 [Enterobacter cloacae]|uniref:hypothetical protein n=1 Tax=Enterobacter cloacae TaxID=550 RepID=UPI00062C6791|nr:hypothetical protein [Enterobacter cloacae]ELE9014063.1 hypothetical protein [Enterobacter cloacae]KKY83042.1 hypothetical protein OA44_07380 [Enterobacter cloacae]MBA7851552.1 hypothetical protein [Enterobacter cloacae]MCU6203113.1 hypothetical protein [Enterobacter cloacae]MCU6229610.1 hypothetical protein [Enterobacter cloacae]